MSIHRIAWAALMGTAVWLATRTAGGEASSSLFRVQSALPAAAGRTRGSGLTLDQVVAPPAPLGDLSSGERFTLLHGWRFPPAVERLYRFALAAGWNLKGAPGTSDREAGFIFTGRSGAPIKIGTLLYPAADGTLVQADDSDPLLGLHAFWVFSYWGGTGQPFAAPEAHQPDDGTAWENLLQPGWNLFSPPYAVTVPARGRIVVVWRWDPGRAAYQIVLPGEVLLPLEGYWVFVLDEES